MPMERGLRIQTTDEVDARCIAEALAEYGPTVEAAGSDSWLVSLSDGRPDYTALLGALRGCLDLHGIASVQVVMSDHTYLMEGAKT
jgi:hypothetical protein